MATTGLDIQPAVSVPNDGIQNPGGLPGADEGETEKRRGGRDRSDGVDDHAERTDGAAAEVGNGRGVWSQPGQEQAARWHRHPGVERDGEQRVRVDQEAGDAQCRGDDADGDDGPPRPEDALGHLRPPGDGEAGEQDAHHDVGDEQRVRGDGAEMGAGDDGPSEGDEESRPGFAEATEHGRAQGAEPQRTWTWRGRRFKCGNGATRPVITFGALARAAYCPRQYYYAKDEDDGPPPAAEARRDLAFRYPGLRTANDAELAAEPIGPSPSAYRAALDRLATRADWAELIDPAEREVVLSGRECRGIAHKILPGDPPTPTFVSPGGPPERGVWGPQRVRAVAVAKALAWECEREIPAALVEYPAHGVVRRVELTTRNKAAYRRTVRTVRAVDGPPPRIDDEAKCDACDYRERCGVRTRSLKSLLGL